MKVFWDNGIVIEDSEDKEFKLILDPERKMKEGVVGVTHAHADHAKAHISRTIATPQTNNLFSVKNFHPLEYGSTFQLDGGKVSVESSNHILGSAQFVVEKDEKIAYTGDFRLSESFFFGQCKPVNCDTLIIESTYGKPEYKFPSCAEVAEQIGKWLKENNGCNVVFGGYRIGKAQELTRILSEFVTPVVHPAIAKVNKIYEANKVRLGDYVSSDSPDAAEIMRGPFVAVVLPNLLTPNFTHSLSRQTKRKTLSALATGWNCGIADKVFQFSDHADFSQLLQYVEEANPKQVFTVHGFENELAGEINKRLKLPARPLKLSLIKKLTEFFG